MARKNLTRDIGGTGLDINWGFINDDFLQDWTGQQKVENITEMVKNEPMIGALRVAMELSIRGVNWFYTSDEENDPRIELADAAIANLTTSWNDHIIDSLLMPFYGWSMFTITYERVNGQMLWRKFKMLGHDTVMQWIFDGDSLEGLKQWPHIYSGPIPIERMLIYKFRNNRGNPEGESILRPAWIPYYFLKTLRTIEGISLERMGAGYPVIELPEDADTSDGSDDLTKAEKLVRNVRIDEQAGIVEPHGWKFRFESPKVGQGVQFSSPIARYKKEILQTALAQFLMIGMESVGARATSESQTDFFTMAIDAVADIIAETHTKYALSRLMKLNGHNADGIRLEHSPAGDIDTAGIADFLQKVGSMITMSPDDEVWLRSLIKMPEKSIEDIQAAHDEQVARDEAMRQAILNRQGNSKGDGQNVDENTAVFFAADNAPDDRERRRFERQWEKGIKEFHRKQQKRIISGVKNAA